MEKNRPRGVSAGSHADPPDPPLTGAPKRAERGKTGVRVAKKTKRKKKPLTGTSSRWKENPAGTATSWGYLYSGNEKATIMRNINQHRSTKASEKIWANSIKPRQPPLENFKYLRKNKRSQQ